MNEIDELVSMVRGEPLADTRKLADQLGVKHQSVYEMVKDYSVNFEQLGLLRFQTGKVTGGRPPQFALLNEDQCYLLLTFSRNTAKVRQLKVNLVLAFKKARTERKRSTMMDRLPLHHQVLDTSAERRIGPPLVWGLLNRFVGVKHCGSMSVRQVSDAQGFCDRIASRAETPLDWKVIGDNHQRLHGESKQLPLPWSGGQT